MNRRSNVLTGPKFRLSLYSIVLALSAGTVITSSIFQDMYDWPVADYPKAAAVLLAGSGLYLITMPVLHFYFHRKRPTSTVSSRGVELSLLAVVFLLCLVGSIWTCASQHNLYKTDPFVPGMAIALEVLGWLTTFGVFVLIVSAILRPRGRPVEKHQRLEDGTSISEMA